MSDFGIRVTGSEQFLLLRGCVVVVGLRVGRLGAWFLLALFEVACPLLRRGQVADAGRSGVLAGGLFFALDHLEPSVVSHALQALAATRLRDAFGTPAALLAEFAGIRVVEVGPGVLRRQAVGKVQAAVDRFRFEFFLCQLFDQGVIAGDVVGRRHAVDDAHFHPLFGGAGGVLLRFPVGDRRRGGCSLLLGGELFALQGAVFFFVGLLVEVLLFLELLLGLAEPVLQLELQEAEAEFFFLFFDAAQRFLLAQADFAEVLQFLEGAREGAVGGGLVAQKAAVLLVIFVGPIHGVLALQGEVHFFPFMAAADFVPEGDGRLGDKGAAGGGLRVVLFEPLLFDFAPEGFVFAGQDRGAGAAAVLQGVEAGFAGRWG